ncbi:MAG: YraN family protein [Eggerthellaceae bacterium]|nr:YraN family protein [Eggerthellaceae bacterium]
MGKKKSDAKRFHNKDLGRRGESAAARYLEMRGYEVIDRNWTCPAGEADIVALDGCTLVFVEVKTRSSFEKGFPSEAVTPEKRARYEKIACWYLRDSDYVDIPVRFDIIALVVVASDRAIVRHYRDAFNCAW